MRPAAEEPALVARTVYCPEVGLVKARGIEEPPSRLVLEHIF